MNEKAYDDVVEKVYQAPLAPEAWTDVIEAIGPLIDGAHGGQFHLWDRRSQRMKYACCPAWMAGDPQRIYSDRYAATDARRRLTDDSAPGEWRVGHDDVNFRFVSRSPPYRETFVPDGIRYSAGAKLHDGADIIAALGILRSAEQGPFGGPQRAALNRLSPHLVRAAALTVRFYDLQEKAKLAVQALDASEDAIFVVGTGGRALISNRAAERLLEAGITLRCLKGVLSAVNADDGRALAVATTAALNERRGAVLHIRDGRYRPSLIGRIVPVPIRSSLHPSGCERAALAVFSAVNRDPPDTDVLDALFGLTPAEARLTQRICSGEMLKQAARASGISIETARTQLKAVFDKTGTHRQADLVRLLGAVPRTRSNAA